MAPVQSRLAVAALSVPVAATLALVLSLVWLKRRRRHHPIVEAPPSSGSPPETAALATSDEPVISSQSSSIHDLTEEDSFYHPQESCCLSKSSDSGVSSEPEFELEPLFAEYERFNFLNASVDEKVSDSIEEIAGKEVADNIELPFVDDKVTTVTTDVEIIEEKVTTDQISEDKVPTGGKIIEEKLTPTVEIIKEKVPSDVEIIEEKVKPEEVIEIVKAEEVIKKVSLEKVDRQPEAVVITPKEEKEEPKRKKKERKSVSISEVVESNCPADMEQSELVEQLASLQLENIKLNESDQGSGERDSANHSPSEVMLASPSISNFSDAHSEGSSDSGKGHSDVATSPSRTPAGGSSVAGDLVATIYEFVVPQVIVGRLIGRHGSFLQKIMTTTHTNIFIKKHPETTDLKVCAIEGGQQDIDKALEMIRQKFPIRRFPKLTLERVSFVNLDQAQLRSEDFHLQLIEGVNNDVVLSSLISGGHFFVQQPSHPTYSCLTNLTQAMTQAYSSPEVPALTTPLKDAVCVAPSMGGWYRVQIVNMEEDGSQCDIKFVDYGGYMRVPTSSLKQIRADFLLLPFQAVECCLANVVPVGNEGWSEEAKILVHNLTFGRVLQAQIINYSEEGIPLVNLYTSIGPQVVLVNNQLVAHGYACFVDQEVVKEDEEATSAADK